MMSRVREDIKLVDIVLNDDLYTRVRRLALTNKIKQLKPDTETGIFQDACFSFIDSINPIFSDTEAPSDEYVKFLKALPKCGELGVLNRKKQFRLPKPLFLQFQDVAVYNKKYGESYKNPSQLFRAALCLYVSQ